MQNKDKGAKMAAPNQSGQAKPGLKPDAKPGGKPGDKPGARPDKKK